MKAAIVDDFSRPPRYGEADAPVPAAGETMIEVRAAALSQLVRAQAAGRHYSSGRPPLIPGADGVGALADGALAYFCFPRGSGSMAERAAVPAENVVPLPAGLDVVTAAAIANPGMSSVAALTRRAKMRPGETVLINGGAGVSGRLAIQIARRLGAGRIVATARNRDSESALRDLGADDFIALQTGPEQLAADFRREIGRGVDIVLDYLWGPPAEAFMAAATGGHSSKAAPRIRFVNIGSLAGTAMQMQAGALRSSGVELMGSGIGSLSHAEIARSVAELFALDVAGLAVDANPAPLADVARLWNDAGAGRVVFTIGPD